MGEGRGGISEGESGKRETDRGFWVVLFCFFPPSKTTSQRRRQALFVSHSPRTEFSGGTERVYRASEIKPLGGSCATLSTHERLRGVWHLNLLQGG